MRRRNAATSVRSAAIKAFFLFLIQFAPTESQDLSGKCVTPKSLVGECVEIRSCPYILSMLRNRQSLETIDTLRRHQCGFQGSQPFVCCPDEITEKAEANEIAEHPNLKLLPRSGCGHRYHNAVVTSKAFLYEYPWMALLRYRDQNGLKNRCGGAIISERYILTAAHCISKLPKGLELEQVRLGEHNLKLDLDCEGDIEFKDCAPPAEDYGIEDMIPHPQFDNRNIQHDIGLIRLDRPINFVRENTQPICLPLEQKPLRDSTRLEIGGWGVTMQGESSEEMLKAFVKTVDAGVCAEMYKKYTNIYNSTHICIDPEYSSGGNCIGDSGGPLMEQTRRSVLRGVMSFALGVCKSGQFPRVYTLVEPYMNWILDSMKD